MSEINKFSVFDVFEQTAETLEQAEERARLEQSRPQVDRFRTSEDGTYSVRVLPIAPEVERNEKGEIIGIKPFDNNGYSYPLQQQFLSIQLPEKNGKKREISVPVIRSSVKPIDLSGDLIDTYVRIAKEKYGHDEDIVKKVSSGNFEGGLKWTHMRVMYVLNLEDKSPKPLLWQPSYSQYRTIDDSRLRLWKEEKAEDEKVGCPLVSFRDAYPLNIIRSSKNKKVEYSFELARKRRPLSEDELMTLLDTPRIPDIIYHFTRYQLEAEKVALEQYDEKHRISITNEQEFKDMYNTLLGELPKDDNSHFSINDAGKDSDDSDGDITIDSLFERYDKIVDAGLSSTSDEYKELRESIREFVQDNKLDVYLSRSMDNLEMLEAVEKAIKDGAYIKDEVEEKREAVKKEPEEKPIRRRSARPVVEEEEKPVEEEKPDEKEADEPVDEQPEEETPRRRRRR